MSRARARFGRYTVALSNQDKVLFPESGITKGDLCAYYRDVADVMLPHVRDRPLSLQRFPDGIDGEGFYQKDVSDSFPGWIHTVRVPRRHGGANRQVLANNTATLVYLANQATVTLHAWPARGDDLEKPDRLVFDLDPAAGDFGVVRDAARDVRAVLQQVGLDARVMTTGSRGLHVTTPLRREASFDAVFAFAESVARVVAARRPDAYTTAFRKARREGRLFLDTRRNLYGQTSVAPYSVRPRPGAPVATPLDWEELERSNLDSRSWSLRSIAARLARRGDAWRGIGRHARAVSEPAARLEEQLECLPKDNEGTS
jgi:bifunctional non-homologous end joining protein LigD